MRERGAGAIVNQSSTAAYLYAGFYGLAKAGVNSLTQQMAHELGGQHIRINAIAPGPIDTDLTATMAPADRQAFIDALPVGRFGRPEEIAATALLLAGPDGGFYVGATLSPNGGDVMY
jgi:3-oxoacyl-[acyl-carrier protein] reductase